MTTDLNRWLRRTRLAGYVLQFLAISLMGGVLGWQAAIALSLGLWGVYRVALAGAGTMVQAVVAETVATFELLGKEIDKIPGKHPTPK